MKTNTKNTNLKDSNLRILLIKEIDIVTKVLKSGILSDFVAANNHKFHGGKYVQNLKINFQNIFL